jgi:dolichol-phosphate mannosyltransferase
MNPAINSRRPPRILVDIPILNEIENIERLVRGVTQALRGYDYLLLVVDGGSTDGTLEYLERAIGEQPGRVALLKKKKVVRGCQRGAALLAGLNWGLQNGDFDIFVEMDGDLSHRPEELPAGIETIARGAADIVIISKYAPGSQIVGRSAHRTIISLICNFAVRIMIRRDLHDFSNGYRFYNRSAAELPARYAIRYGSPIYLTEVMAIWMKHGLKVVEIPGKYMGRDEGRTKVRLVDYIKAAIGVMEIAIRFHFTGFRPIAGSPAIGSHQRAASASGVQDLDG